MQNDSALREAYRYIAVKNKILLQYKSNIVFYYIEGKSIYHSQNPGSKMDFPMHLK